MDPADWFWPFGSCQTMLSSRADIWSKWMWWMRHVQNGNASVSSWPQQASSAQRARAHRAKWAHRAQWVDWVRMEGECVRGGTCFTYCLQAGAKRWSPSCSSFRNCLTSDVTRSSLCPTLLSSRKRCAALIVFSCSWIYTSTPLLTYEYNLIIFHHL